MAESETVGRMAEKSNTETACEMCMKDDARYKCPACSARTCSLECVRGHKSRKQCDGVRKHEFVPVSEFTDTHMHQDISFLSRVKDVAFSSSRTFAKAPYPSPKRGGLRKALRKAYEWKELPEGMSRRNENQTHIKNACIFWTVKLHIHAPLMLSDKIIMLHAKSENDTIESLLPEELLALGKPFGVFLKKEGSQVGFLAPLTTNRLSRREHFTSCSGRNH